MMLHPETGGENPVSVSPQEKSEERNECDSVNSISSPRRATQGPQRHALSNILEEKASREKPTQRNSHTFIKLRALPTACVTSEFRVSTFPSCGRFQRPGHSNFKAPSFLPVCVSWSVKRTRMHVSEDIVLHTGTCPEHSMETCREGFSSCHIHLGLQFQAPLGEVLCLLCSFDPFRRRGRTWLGGLSGPLDPAQSRQIRGALFRKW